MKIRNWITAAFLLLCAVYGQAQDTERQLDVYMSNFLIAPPDMKLELLKEVNEMDDPAFSAVAEQGIDYVLSNSRQVQGSYLSQQMTVYIAKIVQKFGIINDTSRLLRLFEIYNTTSIRVELLRAIYVVGKDEPSIVEWLNEWLSTQNSLQDDGIPVNQQVVAAAVDILGIWALPESFPMVFRSYAIQYSRTITEHARTAMLAYGEDFINRMIELLSELSVSEHKTAQEFLFGGAFDEDQKGAFAAASLKNALNSGSGNLADEIILRDIRQRATSMIARLSYSEATEVMIENFDLTVLEYDRGTGRKYSLLEAVAGLGAMKNDMAGERLHEFLDLINQYTASGDVYDEQIVLAVINNLGQLGYEVAVDSIRSCTQLPYSNGLITQARSLIMTF